MSAEFAIGPGSRPQPFTQLSELTHHLFLISWTAGITVPSGGALIMSHIPAEEVMTLFPSMPMKPNPGGSAVSAILPIPRMYCGQLHISLLWHIILSRIAYRSYVIRRRWKRIPLIRIHLICGGSIKRKAGGRRQEAG